MWPQASSHKFRWFWVPLRVLLVSFLLTLLSFAICLLLGILGLTITAWLRGTQPHLALAYRDFALPAAAIAGLVALVAATVMECRSNGGAGVPPVRN